MSQNSQNPQPAPDGSDWNIAKEKELDSLLDQACSLADQLKTEISGNDPQHTVAGSDEPSHDSIDGAGIDSQLAQIDGLLNSAKAEVGVDTTGPKPATAKQPIPDFMAEFTQDAPPAASTSEKQSDIETARTTQSSASVSGGSSAAAPTANVATATAEDDLEDDLLALSASTPRSPKPTTAAPAPEGSPPKPKSPKTVGGLLSSLLSPLILILTLMNKPFDRISTRVRVVVGYAAIVMLLAAVIVFAITLV